jgi:predicted DCC family thiol-disulfide oxidoreductase YuxK
MTDHLLLYDGLCAICTRSTVWIRRLDRAHRIACTPYQQFDLDRVPGLTFADCERAMQLILPDGRILTGGAAGRYLLRRNGLTWPLGAVAELPIARQVFDAVYEAIARNRRRLGTCDGDTCSRHMS